MAGFTDIADLMKLREFYREFMRSPSTSIRDDVFADRDADYASQRAADQRPLPEEEGYDLRSPDPLFPRDNPVVNFQAGGWAEKLQKMARGIGPIHKSKFAPQFEAADAALSPPHAERLTNFIGVPAGAATNPNLPQWGIWNPEVLNDLTKIPEFDSLRAALKSEYGDTLPLMRVQRPITTLNGKTLDRKYLSWTSDPGFAQSHAGVSHNPLPPFNEDFIRKMEREYADTGIAHVSPYRQLRRERDSPYPNIYHGGEHVTDTDSVRDYLLGINQNRAEDLLAANKKREMIRQLDIPLDDILWGSNRANQSEFIVPNKYAQGGAVTQPVMTPYDDYGIYSAPNQTFDTPPPSDAYPPAQAYAGGGSVDDDFWKTGSQFLDAAPREDFWRTKSVARRAPEILSAALDKYGDWSDDYYRRSAERIKSAKGNPLKYYIDWVDRGIGNYTKDWPGKYDPKLREKYGPTYVPIDMAGALVGMTGGGMGLSAPLQAGMNTVAAAGDPDLWSLAGDAAKGLYHDTREYLGFQTGGFVDKTKKLIRAFHGSPHDFNKFDASKIGTGEGAQAFGYGHYFAESPDVANSYRPKGWRPSDEYLLDGNSVENLYRQLADKQQYSKASVLENVLLHNDRAGIRDLMSDDPAALSYLKTLPENLFAKRAGRLYDVNLHVDPSRLIDIDAPFLRQPSELQELTRQSLKSNGYLSARDNGPRQLNNALRAWKIEHGGMTDRPLESLLFGNNSLLGGSPQEISSTLRNADLYGTKYLDQFSRDRGRGTRNYVMFPGTEDLIEITSKRERGGPIGFRDGGDVTKAMKWVRNKFGDAQAKRMEHAADLTDLERYSEKGLRYTFDPSKTGLYAAIPPSSFEDFAKPIGTPQVPYVRDTYLPNKLRGTKRDPMTLDRYIDLMADNIENRGMDSPPSLWLYKTLDDITGVEGHEGRHRMRAMDQLGDRASLVNLMPANAGELSGGEAVDRLLEKYFPRGGKTIIKPEYGNPGQPRVFGRLPFETGGSVLTRLARKIKGKPSSLRVLGEEVDASPIKELEDVAQEYATKRGRVYPVQEFPEFDEDRARRIAQAYDAMKHDPADPRVRKSYDALIGETMDQYKALENLGLDFHFLRPGEADPYAKTPSLGYLDLIKNGRLAMFPTEQGFGSINDITDNPLLRRVGRVGDLDNATANDAFRVVHDIYGHYAPGNPFFRHKGEDRAWFAHSHLYSPDALPAATSELRGQNSWVNFGPYGERNRRATGADTTYADQKIGRLPDWVWEDAPKFRKGGDTTTEIIKKALKTRKAEALEETKRELNAGRGPNAEFLSPPVDPKLQTVDDPRRVMYPLIYSDPRDLVSMAKQRYAPDLGTESPMYKLFGHTRESLDDLARSNKPFDLPRPSSPDWAAFIRPDAARGNSNTAQVMNPRNERRILDVLGEGLKDPDLRTMRSWYEMSPLWEHMDKLGISDRDMRALNVRMGVMSPQASPSEEIPRGFAANYLSKQGRLEDFFRHGAATNPAELPADLQWLPGHMAHGSHLGALHEFEELGRLWPSPKTNKVLSYIAASDPRLPLYDMPVADSHFTRMTGLPDVRTATGTGTLRANMQNPEYGDLAPWWNRRIADKIDEYPRDAQALAWGLFGPATGVKQIGKPKLEVISDYIDEVARLTGRHPEDARDLLLTGQIGGAHAEGGHIDGYQSGGKINFIKNMPAFLGKEKQNALDAIARTTAKTGNEALVYGSLGDEVPSAVIRGDKTSVAADAPWLPQFLSKYGNKNWFSAHTHPNDSLSPSLGDLRVWGDDLHHPDRRQQEMLIHSMPSQNTLQLGSLSDAIGNTPMDRDAARYTYQDILERKLLAQSTYDTPRHQALIDDIIRPERTLNEPFKEVLADPNVLRRSAWINRALAEMESGPLLNYMAQRGVPVSVSAEHTLPGTKVPMSDVWQELEKYYATKGKDFRPFERGGSVYDDMQKYDTMFYGRGGSVDDDLLMYHVSEY
jgi:hypothetical protein